MGDTPTPKPTPRPELPRPAAQPPQDPVTQAIAAWPFSLEALGSQQRLGVAFSGGADSTALLLACVRRWPGRVVALHINHGLQSAAADFEQHCHSFCENWQIPLQVLQVQAHPASGESPEDAARRARYTALASLCGESDGVADVALAQHADDQVETLLLALSRGAGLAGLSAMPTRFERLGVRYHRPLLGVSGAQIRDGLRAQGVAWIEDPSNANTRYTRNRIRALVLPALEQSFPHFRDTFARSTRHAAQAQALLLELAQADLANLGHPPPIKALQALSPARQANLLRHWLHSTYGDHARPNTAQLDELLSQIAACTTRGHNLHIKVGTGFVLRDGATLRWADPA